MLSFYFVQFFLSRSSAVSTSFLTLALHVYNKDLLPQPVVDIMKKSLYKIINEQA